MLRIIFLIAAIAASGPALAHGVGGGHGGGHGWHGGGPLGHGGHGWHEGHEGHGGWYVERRLCLDRWHHEWLPCEED
jgi:hypothetical protein